MDIVGTFEITSGKIIVSDPCQSYDSDDYFDGAVLKVLNGKWTAFVEKHPDDHTKPGKLMIHNEVAISNDLEWLKLENIFTVSAQVGFFDKDHYRNDNDIPSDKENQTDSDPGDKWYNTYCTNKQHLNQLAEIIPYGVVLLDINDYGDESYNVYGAYKDYKLVALKILFDEVIIPQNDSQPESPKIRYFKLIYDDKSYGKFSGTKPKNAANKALTELAKTYGNNGPFVFSMMESTRGSNHKIYNYEGIRIVLNEPMTVRVSTPLNSKDITYKYYNKLKKIPNISIIKN